MKSEPHTVSNPSRLPSPPAASPLADAITEYQNLQRRRFHVPAHAGYKPSFSELPEALYQADLTEVEGLDVLSEPYQCIAESQKMIAERFGVAHTFMLVNGATTGLTATMLAALQPGEKVLLPRNVHRSVVSGLILTGAEPVWMLPERLPEWGLWGAVDPKEIERQLQAHPDIKALFITSPTYEGIGSDLPAIATLCRQNDVLLIVDEAHGALWPFSDRLPKSACHIGLRNAENENKVEPERFELGADAVIHSMHKSAGSLTQGALAHLPHGSRIDPTIYQQALNTLQTTSPSYILMRDLEATVGWLGSDEFHEHLNQHLDVVQILRQALGVGLQRFKLFTPNDTSRWDPCKLYFSLPGESGEVWGPRLEEGAAGNPLLRVAYESANPKGVLYQAGIGLQPDDFTGFTKIMLIEDRCVAALSEAPANIAEPPELSQEELLPEMAMLPRKAFFAPGERAMAAKSVGRIAKETIVHCPPGIPVLMPGERIRAHHVPLLPEGVLVVQ